jgi:hypothetical protein
MSRKDDAALTGQGMRETPRTDKLCRDPNLRSETRIWGLARQLERELNQAIKDRDEARLNVKPMGAVTITRNGHLEDLERELNQANAIIKECLSLLPVGQIPYHTPESLTSRISSIFAEREHYRKERDKAQSSLRTLMALHEREIETGQPISGEDWEIAGYALGDNDQTRSRICKAGEVQWGFDSDKPVGQIVGNELPNKS